MLVTMEMLWNKIIEQDKKIDALLKKEETYSIEEISLAKAKKLLHRGDDAIIALVEKGKLKARKYRDSKHRVRYRFRLSDIREFQEASKYSPYNYETVKVESSEDVCRRIFGS